MRYAATVLLLLVSVALADSRAQPAGQAAGPCGTWTACMNDSIRAAQVGEFERFHDLAWRAVQMAPPRHPQLMYLLARAQALSGRPGDALVLLERLGRMGVPTNAVTEAHFAAARAHPRWPAVEALLTAARAGRASGEVAFRLPERDLVPESLAYDAASRRFLVGSLHKRKIVEVDEATGRVSDYMTTADGNFLGVVGLKIDEARGTLWACSAAVPEMEGITDEQRGRSRLHRIDVRTGRLAATIQAPAGAHLLNDLAVDPRGDVYVTDSEAGVVYRVRSGGTTLEPLATIGEGLYPNGIAIDTAGRTLYVASFAGITRIETATGRAALVVPAGDIALTGIDGLYYDRGALVAVQGLPGVNRVVRLVLDPRGRRVTGTEVLEANLPEYNWPTTGVITGDTFHYIANAQLRSFEGPGRIWPQEKLQEPVIRRLQLR